MDYRDEQPHDAADANEGFASRHIGPRPADARAMLDALGYRSMDAFIDAVVPERIREREGGAVEAALDEPSATAALRALAADNRVCKSHIGMGYYDCHTPAVIRRNVLENPAWYTAYTPYQSEISQGRLEALLNFQTMVCDLTGFELANASLLDEATAAAEAMMLCRAQMKDDARTVFFVATDCHPQTIAVVRGRAAPLGIEVVIGAPESARDVDGCFGVLLQYPGTFGDIHDFRDLIGALAARQVMTVMAADLLALTLLVPPGELGADIAVGSAQRFGVPMFCGGPHAAYIATHERFKRALPGRLVGVSVDAAGRTAYRLALQSREQHIRRENATSNICTAQALLAIVASMYAVYHGPAGLRAIARRTQRLTQNLASGLETRGFRVPTDACFDTIVVDTGARTQAIHAAAERRGVNLRHIDDGALGISLDETTTPEDLDALFAIFDGDDTVRADTAEQRDGRRELPAALRRESAYLTHPVFNRYHAETEMLRYLRALADRDLALDRTMIPLGSCTMKLNATTEMEPVSWDAFARIHPFAPPAQRAGYAALVDDLERLLCAMTGYDAVSLQPNSGATGEYAGLLAIRHYHASRGDNERDVCLIASSAHGTNPASAHLAGMRIVAVACDAAGNVDVEDLRARCTEHAPRLAALMITYPSTHGVFEPAITEVCDIVHAHGGQVYIDGANLNAMIGLCKPGHFGGDVSHFNLHKTFCIPHGGGGPGVGPVAVKDHLRAFLPGSHADATAAVPPVAAADWGSAGILPISWMYIRLMGTAGLRAATEMAILSANYCAHRLAPHFPVLYTGANGCVAHECIIDPRPLKKRAGVTAEDIAKRLIDYGFHAPTMSFPVPGTLMIEPTESESKRELDRFCDALIAIRQEIRAIEDEPALREDNPLVNAPHTARDLVGDWQHPYTREQAVFPAGQADDRKYWPPVSRIDNAHGDRNLVCACPPLEDYV